MLKALGEAQQGLGFRFGPQVPIQILASCQLCLHPSSPSPGLEGLPGSRTPGWWKEMHKETQTWRGKQQKSSMWPEDMRCCRRGPQPTTCLLTCCGSSGPAPALSGPVSSPERWAQLLIHSSMQAVFMKGGESEEMREQICQKGGREGQSGWGRTNTATTGLAWDCLPGSSVRQMGKL